MRKLKFAGYAALAAVICFAAAGCSSKVKESTAPRVELTQIKDEVVEPVFDGAEIQVLDLQNPIDYSYSSGNADMTFDYREGVWLDGMDPSIPINQEKFQAMADNFLQLHAVSEVELPENLNDYGLGSPAYSLYITDSGNGAFDISIGSQDGAGNYYLLINDSELYTVLPATVESMVFDYDSLVVRDGLDLQVAAADIENAAVTIGRKSVSYDTKDTEAMEKIADGINHLQASAYASYNALEQELVSAELTEDFRTTFQAEINVNGETRSLVVYVGTAADVDNRQRYVQIDGSNMIILVDTSVVNNLLNMVVEETEAAE